MESDDGLKEWLVMIRRYGFCFIDACPVSPEKSQKLLERIAYIRHTHYGGFYDFTSNLSSKDMAYTNLSLPAHTDTAYFEDPAGLQMFHLLSHTDGEGGASLLVDGFRAAKQLMMRNQRAYEILRTTNIYHHSSGNPDFSIRSPSPSPVISANAKGHIKQIRWNNEDRTTLHVDSGHIRIMGWKEALDQWYDAASELSRIMKKEESEYWEQLRPGRALVFDNWRTVSFENSETPIYTSILATQPFPHNWFQLPTQCTLPLSTSSSSSPKHSVVLESTAEEWQFTLVPPHPNRKAASCAKSSPKPSIRPLINGSSKLIAVPLNRPHIDGRDKGECGELEDEDDDSIPWATE
ncbi:MAG: hypothetical protein M1829_000639 [Trizodia sp. TS-e1964]|nr:MAG: hypothetical protein M1829_000639 [Trizodia sp. TS-e1964]